jgi:hypothetical protein
LFRVYAVTEPRGDVLVWEPHTWGEASYLNLQVVLPAYCIVVLWLIFFRTQAQMKARV